MIKSLAIGNWPNLSLPQRLVAVGEIPALWAWSWFFMQQPPSLGEPQSHLVNIILLTEQETHLLLSHWGNSKCFRSYVPENGIKITHIFPIKNWNNIPHFITRWQTKIRVSFLIIFWDCVKVFTFNDIRGHHGLVARIKGCNIIIIEDTFPLISKK